MDVKRILESFFEHYKKQISIEELVRQLHINQDQINILLENLYELEKAGKIFYDKNKTYMYVPKEFYCQWGILKKSNSNQYYVKTKNGYIYQIKNLQSAKEGDIVFVSKIKSKECHPKHYDGKIERIVKKEMLNSNSSFIIKGILKKEGIHFYVTENDNRIYIPKESLNTAFIGDTINVQVKNHTGTVIQVLKRHNNQHVFKCVKKDNKLKWIPISSSYGFYTLDKKKMKEGDLVLAEIEDNHLKFIQKIENSHTVQDDINALTIDFGFRKVFPDVVLEESKKISTVIKKEDLENREDLRSLETFTIDPIDAKDLDDAISLEYKDDLYYLYVHTANPTHYIKISSPIFKEAFKRSFSVYPANGVIPMLPESLSSEVCSLNENGDKLSITCKMVLDKKGQLKDFRIFKSIIKSNKQMNYDEVNTFLETQDINHPYYPYKDTLLKMRDLANILQTNKTKRGTLNFESEEKQFILDKQGNPIGITEKQRGESQQIIENFMLLANETISKYAYYLELPYIYRNHEQPTVQKKISLKQNLVQKGYFIQKIGNVAHPEYMQRVLTSLLKGKNKEEKKIISSMFLKSMERAYYDNKNLGHYGLSLDCYGTFTSPARKISDFLNHMIIEEFLDHGLESKKISIYKEFIEDSCEYISQKQKDADILEQEMNLLMLNKYAENFINIEVKAKILFINRYGIYVKDTNGLTGFIPIDKNMLTKNGQVQYFGKIYKQDEQITVSLKEKKGHELIYSIPKKIEEKQKVLKKEGKKNE